MDIKQKIKDTFFEMFEEELRDSEFLKNWSDLEMDDLDTVEFIMRLEADLNVSISDGFLEQCETPHNLLTYLNQVVKS